MSAVKQQSAHALSGAFEAMRLPLALFDYWATALVERRGHYLSLTRFKSENVGFAFISNESTRLLKPPTTMAHRHPDYV